MRADVLLLMAALTLNSGSAVTVTAGKSLTVPPDASVVACVANCFYVEITGNDSNPGTEGSPWRTLGKCASTLTAGQTCVVGDGTYVEAEVQFQRP